MKKIGWIGLGTMGEPMARNLANAGYPVVAYNRSPKVPESFSGQLVTSIREACEGADVVVVMVSDGAAVRQVVFGEGGAANWMPRGSLIVNMSTIGVDETKEFSLLATDVGVEWMDAPVSGSRKPAEDGTLVVLAGGSDAAFETMLPMFKTMAKASHHLGPIGSGSTAKLLVNACLALVVEGVSECMAVADKAGLGHARLLEVLQDTAVWSPILAGKRQLWLDEEYPAAFALKHMTKDVGLMANYSTQLSAAMPTVLSVLGVYLGAQAEGLAENDMASVFKHVSKLVGSA